MNEIMNLAHRIKVAVLAEVGEDYNSMLDSRVASIDYATQKIVDEFTSSDYWTRLEHQYAGMAMQVFLASGMENTYENIAEFSINQAHALVEKYKKEEK